jgi:hypothetical protein
MHIHQGDLISLLYSSKQGKQFNNTIFILGSADLEINSTNTHTANGRRDRKYYYGLVQLFGNSSPLVATNGFVYTVSLYEFT